MLLMDRPPDTSREYTLRTLHDTFLPPGLCHQEPTTEKRSFDWGRLGHGSQQVVKLQHQTITYIIKLQNCCVTDHNVYFCVSMNPNTEILKAWSPKSGIRTI